MEIYDIIDFGETETFFHEYDGADYVYGLSYKFFPNQAMGSPDYGYGEMWHSDMSFNQYSQGSIEGSFQFPFITIHSTELRGEITYEMIYTDKTEEGMGSSYQFPIRLVAAKGDK